MRVGAFGGRSSVEIRDQWYDLSTMTAGAFGSDPMEMYERWQELRAWHAGAQTTEIGRPIEACLPGNPVPRPSQVFAIGANYLTHIEEAGAEVPASPSVFTKFPSCLIGPTDVVPLPSTKVDWEVELVIVIGARVESAPDRPWEVVAGVTVGQDISERRIQLQGSHPQFSLGKSFRGFGPVGPWVVSPDELADPDDLELGCSVDGLTMQSDRTSNLIYPVPDLIRHLSSVCVLEPGDLIFTGTPSGVGAFRTPRRFLRPGETIDSWISSVGSMSNPVVAGPTYAASVR